MPINKQEIFFNESGLNTDITDRLKPMGTSDEILNEIVSFIDGQVGARTNVKGNRLINNFGDNYTAIGWTKDIERNAVIVFLHNTSAVMHRIASINISTNVVTEIVSSARLEFSLDHKITHANVVDNLLYWTDGNSEPKKINLDKIPSVTTFIDEHFTAARRPPHNPPTVFGISLTEELGYGDAAGANINNLRREQFQFAYRFIYEDDEKSNFSPFSIVPTPNNEELLRGIFDPVRGNNSFIRMSMDSGSALVTKIELAVKIGDLGAWQSYEVINKEEQSISDNTTFNYVFRNDRVPTVLEQSDVLINNNVSPQLADVQEFLPTNQLAYGGVTEGYDNIDINIDTSLNITTRAASVQSGLFPYQDNYTQMHYIIVTLPDPVPNNLEIVRVRMQLPDGNVRFISIEQERFGTSLTNLKDQIIARLPEFFGTRGSTNFIIGDGPFVFRFDPNNGDVWLFGPDDNPGGFPDTYQATPFAGDSLQSRRIYIPSWINPSESASDIFAGGAPAGQFYPNIVQRIVDSFVVTTEATTSNDILNPQASYGDGVYEVGIVYEDGFGRTSTVQLSDDSRFTVSSNQFDTSGPTYDPGSGRIQLDLSVLNRPPEWARYWRPVITRNQAESVVATWVPDFVYGQRTNDRGNLLISISSSLTESIELTGGQLSSYTFEPGDFVRVVGEINQDLTISRRFFTYPIINDEFNIRQTRTVTSFSEQEQELVSNVTDAEDSEGNPLFNQSFQTLVVDYDSRYDTDINATTRINRNSIIEIVRPMKDVSTDIYFGTGQSFDIGNPGQSDRYHMGSPQNQSSSDPSGTPAIVRMEAGGRYSRMRYDASKRINFPVLSNQLSDLYRSEFYSTGKPYVENEDVERRKYNLLRHSGIFFDNTNVNNLSQFGGSDFQTVDDKFGEIQKIIQVGDALKVYQPLKTTSIYIGKSFLKEGLGSDQVVTVDRTFGVVNPSVLDYGCQFPESVLRNERYVYFFDIFSQSFMRDSANGLEAVSKYGMVGYFKNKSEALLASGINNVNVYTGYDDENELVFVSFVDSVTPANNETLAFHEDSNTWTSFYSFIPDLMLRFSDRFYSFNGGGMWIHNDSTVDRCSFYGTKYPRRFRVYANVAPNTVKVFTSLALHTNTDGWSAPQILVKPTATYSRGMESRLKSGKFTYEEGIGYAEFMRNMKTTSDTLSVTDLATGDELRGEVMSVLLEESGNDEVTLFEVDINFIV